MASPNETATWILQNWRLIDSMAKHGNARASDVQNAIKLWRRAISKGGPTHDKLVKAIGNWRMYISSARGQKDMQAALSRYNGKPHQTPRPAPKTLAHNQKGNRR